VKIDIGPDGKILGTKRVSTNGQISGFTEYAGAEVLVVLPGGSQPIVRRDARDVLDEVEKIVEERMKLAFQEYKNLRRRFPTPREAAKSFMATAQAKNLKGVVDRTDQWLRQQVSALEARVEHSLTALKPQTSKPKRKK
jgi:ElaB/YqjD/DUF883 family membrane-anchored ribosome-binding protein